MDTNERLRSGSRPSSQRARWLLIGSIILAAGLLGYWYSVRGGSEDPWNNQAIQARFASLVVQRPETAAQPQDENADADDEKPQTDVHVILHYVLVNNTSKPYSMPPPAKGSLMKNLIEQGPREVDTVVWDGGVIPAGKTGDVEFDVTLDLKTEDLSGEELQSHQDLVAFCNRRFKQIRDFVFYDYAHQYAINLPGGWD